MFFIGNALVDLFLQSRNWPFGSAIAVTLVVVVVAVLLGAMPDAVGDASTPDYLREAVRTAGFAPAALRTIEELAAAEDVLVDAPLTPEGVDGLRATARAIAWRDV